LLVRVVNGEHEVSLLDSTKQGDLGLVGVYEL
jgi:hypothetical protein